MMKFLQFIEEYHPYIKDLSEGIFNLFGLGGLLIIIASVLYLLLSGFVYAELQKRWIRVLTTEEYEEIIQENTKREESSE